MDASQYKDYVLVLLFVKYDSDRYAGLPYTPITIPAGAGFADMVALKGKTDIGDRINKKVLGPLQKANNLYEVSRVIAQILGIRHVNSSNDTAVYDPTCSSGS